MSLGKLRRGVTQFLLAFLRPFEFPPPFPSTKNAGLSVLRIVGVLPHSLISALLLAALCRRVEDAEDGASRRRSGVLTPATAAPLAASVGLLLFLLLVLVEVSVSAAPTAATTGLAQQTEDDSVQSTSTSPPSPSPPPPPHRPSSIQPSAPPVAPLSTHVQESDSGATDGNFEFDHRAFASRVPRLFQHAQHTSPRQMSMPAATPPKMAAIADNEGESRGGEDADEPVSSVLLLGPSTLTELFARSRGEATGAKVVAADGEGVGDAAVLLAKAC